MPENDQSHELCGGRVWRSKFIRLRISPFEIKTLKSDYAIPRMGDDIINPWRACAVRVTVVVLCVCMFILVKKFFQEIRKGI